MCTPPQFSFVHIENFHCRSPICFSCKGMRRHGHSGSPIHCNRFAQKNWSLPRIVWNRSHKFDSARSVDSCTIYINNHRKCYIPYPLNSLLMTAFWCNSAILQPNVFLKLSVVVIALYEDLSISKSAISDLLCCRPPRVWNVWFCWQDCSLHVSWHLSRNDDDHWWFVLWKRHKNESSRAYWKYAWSKPRLFLEMCKCAGSFQWNKTPLIWNAGNIIANFGYYVDPGTHPWCMFHYLNVMCRKDSSCDFDRWFVKDDFLFYI